MANKDRTIAWKEFWMGARAELPILLGITPFGMIYGVLALNAGLTPLQSQAMSSIVHTGSSQFMLVQLVNLGTPALIMIATVLIIGLRHALYSLSVAPYLQGLSPLWKVILSYLLTDEAYAVAIMRLQHHEHSQYKHWYLLGAGIALWVCWQLSTAAGIFLGAQVPLSWGLDFTLTLTFIAVAVPAINDNPSLFAAIVAGLTSILTRGLPYKLNLIAAAIAGIAAGLWRDRQ